MLKATDEEIEDVRKYFEWQAPDLEVTFMQKVYSQAVLSTRHDVWDRASVIHPKPPRFDSRPLAMPGGRGRQATDQCRPYRNTVPIRPTATLPMTARSIAPVGTTHQGRAVRNHRTAR